MPEPTPHAVPRTAAKQGEQQPLVSVCVPHYNLGRHLPETLASLAEQTYRDIEVMVIDDGSTDPSSRTVFQELEERYPRFRFLRRRTPASERREIAG